MNEDIGEGDSSFLGSLGTLLSPLDYPRQALWNLGRSGYRAATGQGNFGDVARAAPGALGAVLAALAAGSGVGMPLALGLGTLGMGLGQAGGRLSGADFEAPGGADVAQGLGLDPGSLPGLGVGMTAQMAGDPLLWLSSLGALKGVQELRGARGAEDAWLGTKAAGVGEELSPLGRAYQEAANTRSLPSVLEDTGVAKSPILQGGEGTLDFGAQQSNAGKVFNDLSSNLTVKTKRVSPSGEVAAKQLQEILTAHPDPASWTPAWGKAHGLSERGFENLQALAKMAEEKRLSSIIDTPAAQASLRRAHGNLVGSATPATAQTAAALESLNPQQVIQAALGEHGNVEFSKLPKQVRNALMNAVPADSEPKILAVRDALQKTLGPAWGERPVMEKLLTAVDQGHEPFRLVAPANLSELTSAEIEASLFRFPEQRLGGSAYVNRNAPPVAPQTMTTPVVPAPAAPMVAPLPPAPLAGVIDPALVTRSAQATLSPNDQLGLALRNLANQREPLVLPKMLPRKFRGGIPAQPPGPLAMDLPLGFAPETPRLLAADVPPVVRPLDLPPSVPSPMPIDLPNRFGPDLPVATPPLPTQLPTVGNWPQPPRLHLPPVGNWPQPPTQTPGWLDQFLSHSHTLDRFGPQSRAELELMLAGLGGATGGGATAAYLANR